MKRIPQAQPLAAYESRRYDVEKSSEPIEGIFFIIGDKLVPDYYSECLFSAIDTDTFSKVNKQNLYKRSMFHDYFFLHYIRYVYVDFTETVDNAKLIPRGRVKKQDSNQPGILIDMCRFNDEGLLADIIELYRLNGEISVINNSDYRCPACWLEQSTSAISYVIRL